MNNKPLKARKPLIIQCTYCRKPKHAPNFVVTKSGRRLKLCGEHYAKFSYRGPTPFRVVYLTREQRTALHNTVAKQERHYGKKTARSTA